MKAVPFSLVVVTTCAMSVAAQSPERVPPGIHKALQAPKPADGTPPAFIPQEGRTADAAQLKRDADELAKLAQAVPPQVEKLANGELPRDLNDHLKRIEKLSKKLRRQIGP
jgi:hypothetical protein